MIFIKEKVKDFPAMIFLLIFVFWAGTVCGPFCRGTWRHTGHTIQPLNSSIFFCCSSKTLESLDLFLLPPDLLPQTFQLIHFINFWPLALCLSRRKSVTFLKRKLRMSITQLNPVLSIKTRMKWKGRFNKDTPIYNLESERFNHY